ncbi:MULTISPECIES: hypothetical protein [unclassified Pseudomonas]|uniref:hypothetical protein n=1 Tax=unclassified Pseudomonas TaxID=196821 RepID=UPI00385D1759
MEDFSKSQQAQGEPKLPQKLLRALFLLLIAGFLFLLSALVTQILPVSPSQSGDKSKRIALVAVLL